MRTLIIVAMLALAAALFAGCGQVDSDPVEVSRGDNGCVVYRVNPGFFENYVYYTVCRPGERVSTERNVGCGKNCTRRERVETVPEDGRHLTVTK